MKRRGYAWLALLLCSAALLFGQSVDDDLDFFSSDSFADESIGADFEERENLAEESSPWSFSSVHQLTNTVAVNTAQPADQPDFVGFTWLDSRWRGGIEISYAELLRLQIDWQAQLNLAYQLRGEENYDADFLADNEKDVFFRRALLEFSPTDWLTVQAGADILRWGRADLLPILDLLNPTDFRNLPPLLTSPSELKWPLLLTGLQLQQWGWQLSSYLLFAGDGNRYPLPDSEWLAEGPKIPTSQPPLKNIDLALALEYFGSQFDLAFYYSLFDDKTPYLRRLPSPGKLAYPRLHLFGLASSLELGDFVLKAEAGFSLGQRSFPKVDDNYSRLSLMLGADYFFPAFENSYVTVEVSHQHNFNYEEDGLTYAYNPLPQSTDLAVKLHWSFDDRTPFGVDAQVLLRALPELDNGGFWRLGLFFQPLDLWELELGHTHYLKGDTPTTQELDRASKIYFSSILFLPTG